MQAVRRRKHKHDVCSECTDAVRLRTCTIVCISVTLLEKGDAAVVNLSYDAYAEKAEEKHRCQVALHTGIIITVTCHCHGNSTLNPQCLVINTISQKIADEKPQPRVGDKYLGYPVLEYPATTTSTRVLLAAAAGAARIRARPTDQLFKNAAQWPMSWPWPDAS